MLHTALPVTALVGPRLRDASVSHGGNPRNRGTRRIVGDSRCREPYASLRCMESSWGCEGRLPMPRRTVISFAVAGVATVLLAALVVVAVRPASDHPGPSADTGKALFLAKGCAT